MGDVRQIEHLIIQTAFVGDLLLSIPLLKELRRLRPNDRLVLLCRKGLGSFHLQAGLIDEAIEFDKSAPSSLEGAMSVPAMVPMKVPLMAATSSWRSVRAKLRARSFDLIICPHESPRSRLLVSQLKANRKIGYRAFLNFLVFTDQIARPMDLPEAIRQLALLSPLDSAWVERLQRFRETQDEAGGVIHGGRGLSEVPTWAGMEIEALVNLGKVFRAGASDQELLKAGASSKLCSIINYLSLNKRDRIAILAPGSVWPTKMWTQSGYIECAQALIKDGFRVILTGAPNETQICNRIVETVPGVISIAGQTDLFESAQILALAHVLICNDSGAMHMAAAGGVPTVSIFGPTVLKFGYRPWQNRAHVESVELRCRPCGKHGSKECPLGTHDCMKQILSERVLKSAYRLLDESSK